MGTDFAKVKAEEQRFEFETNKTVDVPTDLESSLKNFRVYVAEPYDRNFIYKLFSRVQARINNDDNDFGFYKSLVVSRILSDYEKNKKKTLELLNINASFEKELAELEDEEEDDDNDMKEMIKSVLESSRYYPGDYEISILSELSKVNIIIESRKTKDNPDKLRCLGRQSSDFFIILKKQVDTKTKLPIYSLYAKNGTKYILTSNDIDPRLSKCFDIKCKTFTLGKGAKNAAANMDLICPPYKKKKDDE